MNSRKTIAILCAFIAALVITIFRMQIGISHREDPTQRLERGRNLVENVAMCADCHSPRGPTGQLDRSRWLLGGSLGFKPLMEMPWATVAPSIAGLSGYTDEQAIKFFMTGERPNGMRPLPPMPEYRMNLEDATDVVAYLKSLAPSRS